MAQFFAYDHFSRLGYFMTSQIMLCKLMHEIGRTHVDVLLKIVHVWIVKSHGVC